MNHAMIKKTEIMSSEYFSRDEIIAEILTNKNYKNYEFSKIYSDILGCLTITHCFFFKDDSILKFGPEGIYTESENDSDCYDYPVILE